MAVPILDTVQVLDQQVAAAGLVAEQSPDLVQRGGIEDPALGDRPHPEHRKSRFRSFRHGQAMHGLALLEKSALRGRKSKPPTGTRLAPPTVIMRKARAYSLTPLGILLVAALSLSGCGPDPDSDAAMDGEAGEGSAGTGVVGGPVAPGEVAGPAPSTIVRDQVVYTPEDIEIFEETMAWALENRLDTMQIGDIIVRIGQRFVGNPYTAQTLEIPGPERVVVNLRELDCVTYVESVLAMARLVRDGGGDFDDFVNELARIRYRDGELDGYISRLHYFSEWIANNEEAGLVQAVTADLGGRPDDEAIDFMSTHSDAYPKLDGQPDLIREIREIERTLSERSRTYIPKAEIAGVAEQIRDGDIIAATSSVEGLDIAHTGFALWQDGELHLMHAPLVGSVLEISELPLADRILRIDGQDGIMVARPR